ncbi:hypothetical protein [Paraburkholderia domus]|uniref:hypothetical protein n=1 Tax=Paraburkholderia domus TaxID=2793075 RepID=UPI001913C538|nr:hypothetical protein [Paraburkholderia domus]MBK5064861.1 hypothetical protein [Burkholderia sp. R-70199]CAE6967710.1 hypothetical protein R70199_07875 [Paraburkholderia domus]
MAMHKQQAGLVWPDAHVVIKHVDSLAERFDLSVRDAYNLYFWFDCNLAAATAWQQANIEREAFGQIAH